MPRTFRIGPRRLFPKPPPPIEPSGDLPAFGWSPFADSLPIGYPNLDGTQAPGHSFNPATGRIEGEPFSTAWPTSWPDALYHNIDVTINDDWDASFNAVVAACNTVPTGGRHLHVVVKRSGPGDGLRGEYTAPTTHLTDTNGVKNRMRFIEAEGAALHFPAPGIRPTVADFDTWAVPWYVKWINVGSSVSSGNDQVRKAVTIGDNGRGWAFRGFDFRPEPFFADFTNNPRALYADLTSILNVSHASDTFATETQWIWFRQCRVYAYGHMNIGSTLVNFAGRFVAIEDSHIIGGAGAARLRSSVEPKCISMVHCRGPIKIWNNLLLASGIHVFTGGSDPQMSRDADDTWEIKGYAATYGVGAGPHTVLVAKRPNPASGENKTLSGEPPRPGGVDSLVGRKVRPFQGVDAWDPVAGTDSPVGAQPYRTVVASTWDATTNATLSITIDAPFSTKPLPVGSNATNGPGSGVPDTAARCEAPLLASLFEPMYPDFYAVDNQDPYNPGRVGFNPWDYSFLYNACIRPFNWNPYHPGFYFSGRTVANGGVPTLKPEEMGFYPDHYSAVIAAEFAIAGATTNTISVPAGVTIASNWDTRYVAVMTGAGRYQVRKISSLDTVNRVLNLGNAASASDLDRAGAHNTWTAGVIPEAGSVVRIIEEGAAKNIWELKKGVRVVCAFNVFKGMWLDAQNYTLNVKITNQADRVYSSLPTSTMGDRYAVTKHVIIYGNTLEDCPNGISVNGGVAQEFTTLMEGQHHTQIAHCLFVRMGGPWTGRVAVDEGGATFGKPDDTTVRGTGAIFSSSPTVGEPGSRVNQGLNDTEFVHCTVDSMKESVWWDATKMLRHRLQYNVMRLRTNETTSTEYVRDPRTSPEVTGAVTDSNVYFGKSATPPGFGAVGTNARVFADPLALKFRNITRGAEDLRLADDSPLLTMGPPMAGGGKYPAGANAVFVYQMRGRAIAGTPNTPVVVTP